MTSRRLLPLLPLPCRGCWRRLSGGQRQQPAQQQQQQQQDEAQHHQQLGEPELDWPSILDPARAPAWRENAKRRGATADIDLVLRLSAEEGDSAARQRMAQEAARLPNWTHPEAPVGDNRPVRFIGQAPGQQQQQRGQDALTLLQELRLLASRNLSLITGARTHYLRGQLAQLESALVAMALDVASEYGFKQIGVPELVPPELVAACGFPTDSARSQVFLAADCVPGGQLALIGTAEVPLAAYAAAAAPCELPLRLCAVSRCFRREVSPVEDALYRVPQFTKVELFVVAGPGESEAEHQRLVALQGDLLGRLGLHCRLLDMAAEELGAPAYRKYDWEAWLPSAGRYGELSSASNCTDYQSRRLGIRLAGGAGGFAHTLNGTACAVTRTIKALVETHWRPAAGSPADGVVALPAALAPYMAPYPVELGLLRRPAMRSVYFSRLQKQPLLL